MREKSLRFGERGTEMACVRLEDSEDDDKRACFLFCRVGTGAVSALIAEGIQPILLGF